MPQSSMPAIGEMSELSATPKPQIGLMEPIEEPSFFEGMKAGLTAQPGEGVGHFIGSAIPAGVGAALGSVIPGGGTAIGAALGEAARQTAGAIVNPEETAKKSGLGIGAQVIAAGAGQKAGEMASPYISAGIQKVGSKIAGATDWLATRIGKQFLKASKTLNAYGHEPEKAIIEEKIVATSWDDLISKAGAKMEDLGGKYGEIFSKSPGKNVSINSAIKPINTALKEAKKYPETNANVINKLESLRRDVVTRIRKASTVVSEYEIKPGEIPEVWTKDLQNTFGKEMMVINKGVGPVLPWPKNAPKGVAEDILDAELIGKKLVMSAESANNIKREIYGLTKYTGNPSDDAAINKTKQYVAAAINKEVEKSVPEISEINRRFSNLIALEKAAEHRAIVAERNNILGIPEFAATGVLLTGNVPAAIATEVGGRVIGTPTGATIAMSGLEAIKPLISSPMWGSIAEQIAAKTGGAITAAEINSVVESNQIKADYKAGKIDRATAAQMLRENHGFQ